MKILNSLTAGILAFAFVCTIQTSCEKTEIITPSDGYQWPDNERIYWPTVSWETASLEELNVDPEKIMLADQFAKNDTLAEALLLIKDGYIAYEKYYGNCDTSSSTNLWSATKSLTSALVGLLYDQEYFSSPNQRMADLMPDYPDFNEITLHHVLTQTTGLSWVEYGPLWVQWIFSDDWVQEALSRGQATKAGKKFYYSSANSHFLTSLVYYKTGISPGNYINEFLFKPMGIPFNPLNEIIVYNRWEEYIEPLEQSWRQDTKGIETASFGLFLTARDMAKFGFLFLNKGRWEDEQLLSENWVELSTRDYETNINGRYSYGYQWWLTLIGEHPAFLASGFGGQIIGIVPDLDLVVVLKYEAENPVHPETGTAHDEMHLFELVVNAVKN